MAATNNTALPPVPVNTPMLTTLGLVAWEWLAFFGGLVTQLLANTPPFSDSVSLVKDDLDATKQARLEIGGLTTATTRVVTLPDHDVTVESNDDLAADSSADLTLTTSYQDVAGATVTLNKDGVWLIIGSFEFSMTVSAGAANGQLLVNGVAQAGLVVCQLATATGTDTAYLTGSRAWRYPNAGSKVAKLQALKTTNAGTGTAYHPATGLVAVYLHP